MIIELPINNDYEITGGWKACICVNLCKNALNYDIKKDDDPLLILKEHVLWYGNIVALNACYNQCCNEKGALGYIWYASKKNC